MIAPLRFIGFLVDRILDRRLPARTEDVDARSEAMRKILANEIAKIRRDKEVEELVHEVISRKRQDGDI